MNTERPIHLDLMKIKFPVTAIVSILHRITGILVFLSLPMWLYLFQQALTNMQGFVAVQAMMSQPIWQAAVWVALSAALYHVLAGIRHILMDFAVGDSVAGARFTAWLLMLLALVAAVLAGVWIW